MRRLVICLLFFLNIAPAISYSEDFHESQLNRGIRNSDAYSYLLIHKAGEDQTKSIQFLKTAISYSPDLPATYFEMAKASFSFSAAGIADSIDYAVLGINAYSRNFWWSFTLMGSLFLNLILSFTLSFALIVAVRFFADISLISHDIAESNSKALLLLVIAALSATSPFLFLGGTLVLLGIYMRRYDKAVVYLFLLFLLLFPILSGGASMYFKASSSGSLKAIEKVNEGRDSGWALSALEKGDDYASLFSYALALKRQGKYEEAIVLYKRLFEIRRDPRIYVNLGNCYVGLYNFDEGKKGNLEEALKFYTASVNIKPLASAYYNLSQISREMLDFTRGEEYFKSALSLDRVSVSGYRIISGRKPNRFVVDETLDSSELWDNALSRYNILADLGVAVIPSAAVSLVALLLGVSFYFLSGRLRHHAYRCRKCGKILCPKCEKRFMWGQMCPQCYGSLVKLDELDVKERVARLLSIYEQQTRRRDTLKVLSYVMPGLSQVYTGKVLLGFLFLWLFLFFVLFPATVWMFVPNSHIVSHGIFKWASLFVAGMLYLICHIFTRKRIAKGWL